MRVAALIFAFLSLSLAQSTTEHKGKVSGTVINALTKEPLRRAEVSLQPMNAARTAAAFGPNAPGIMMGSHKTIADNEGKYIIDGIEEGTYTLQAQRTGFLPAHYGAHTYRAPGSQIRVAAGQEVTGLKIEMTPQAVISGRVVDEEGEPMQGVAVQAVGNRPASGARGGGGRPMRAGFGGNRGAAMPLSTTQTDDRGEFRLINLSPGSVILQISPARWGGAPVSASSKEPELGYVQMYYPGVTDPGQASKIDVTPGAELSGFEMKLQRTRVFRVKGRVLDPDGQPAKNYSVNLMARNAGFMGPTAQQFNRAPDGGFELRNVAPGSYKIWVRTNTGARGGATFSEPFEMGSRDVEGLVLRLSPPVTVNGQVLTQGDQKVEMSRMRIMLMGDMPSFSQPGQVREDGTFQLDNVSPGKYHIVVMGVDTGYIASVRYGETDALAQEVEITGNPAPIRITVSAGGGTVSGTVSDDSKPATGSVFVIPSDPNLRVQSMIRSGPLDQNGMFTLSNLRPGDYLAFAMEEPEYGIWEDDAEWRKLESKAKKVSVQATGTESIALAVIK